MNAQDIALGVFEPGSLIRSHHADMLHRLESREVLFPDFSHYIADFETERGVLGLRPLRLGNQSYGGLAAAGKDEISIGGKSFRGKTELFFVKVASAVHIDDGKDRGNRRLVQHVFSLAFDQQTSTVCAGPDATIAGMADAAGYKARLPVTARRASK